MAINMAINKAISAVVFCLAAVLLHKTSQVDALCACRSWYRTPSDYADMGAVVLRAEVVYR